MNKPIIDEEIENKINALNAKTVLRKRHLEPGLVEEWHEHPETKEIIVVHTRAVPDGECVAFESDIIKVYPYKKDFANCIRTLEYTFQRLDTLAQELHNG